MKFLQDFKDDYKNTFPNKLDPNHKLAEPEKIDFEERIVLVIVLRTRVYQNAQVIRERGRLRVPVP